MQRAGCAAQEIARLFAVGKCGRTRFSQGTLEKAPSAVSVRSIMQIAIRLLVVSLMFVSAGALRAQTCGCTSYQIVQKVVYDQVPTKAYRLEYETVMEERQITTQRPEWTTEMRERRFTVAKPVTETATREERYL